MTKTVTNTFRLSFCNNVIREVANTRNTYYLAFGKHVQFTTGDDNIPTPKDNTKEVMIDPYKEIIAGKKITVNDLAVMTKRVDWANNTKYDSYSHDEDLSNKNFYVSVDEGAMYYVYKVLDNNNGANSVIKPNNTSESACNFITSDGYVWKLMYKIPEADFEKFATVDYMPVLNSANVAGNTVPGAIDVIKISNNGSGYNLSLYGQFNADDVRTAIPSLTGNNITYRLNPSASSNTNYYVNSAIVILSGTGAGQVRSIVEYFGNTRVLTVNSAFTVPPDTTSTYVVAPNVIITGDGTNAAAWAQTSSNATVNGYIKTIFVVDRGQNFTYASAGISGNTLGGSNTASVKVIIPPSGGHGKNSQVELGANVIAVCTTISNSEGGTIPIENDFRASYIIKNPLFTYVTLGLANAVGGTFTQNERVAQVKTKKLSGLVSGNASSNTVVGSGTSFNELSAGENIILFDSINSIQHFCNVVSVTNSTHMTVDSRPITSLNGVNYSIATITAEADHYGNSLPYVTLSNCEPRFVVGENVIGLQSGVYGTISNVSINSHDYNNWSTFDNRVKVGYSSVTGAISEDTVLYQTDTSLVNTYFHSSNTTFLFLSDVRGAINLSAGENLQEAGGNNYYTLTGTKYNSDLTPQTGEVLYMEYVEPISRSASQSETIKVLLKF